MKNELEKHQLNANSLSPEAEFNIIDQIPEELIWLENFTSKATQKTYKSTVKKFCAMFEIQNLDNLRSISSMHIIKFRDAMKANGEKNSSINNRMAGLSSLFKHLIEKQIIKVNPVYGVKAMQKNYRKVSSRALNNQEVQAILNQPNTTKLLGLRDKAILSILFNVGSRVGTISNLKISDVYEEDGYMILDMHLKGDKRNRVAVNSHIQASIRNYFKELGYYDENNKLKTGINHDLPVFSRMSNNPKLNDLTKSISTKSIWQLWNKYVLKAGIERTRPHCARSTFITEAFKAGGDLQHIQKTAGHSDPRTTESYNHNAMEHKNSASFKVSFG
jgi:site-specific recombinase XerD